MSGTPSRESSGNIPLDMVEIDLKNAWQHLGEIIGEAVSEI